MYQMHGKKSVTFLYATAALIAASLAPVAAEAAELVMFWRGGCVWCQRWDREIGTIYDRTPEAKILPLRRVDVDRQNASSFTLKEPVRYTPTFVVIDGGREIGRITGYSGDDQFWGLLGALAAKIEPSREPDRI